MPSMNYEPIGWEDAPSKVTPLSAENLNHMDIAIASLYRDLAALEETIRNLSVQDATNMTATFGEEGDEGADDANLQPSGSTIGDIVTGVHSRIRALASSLSTAQSDISALNEKTDEIGDEVDALAEEDVSEYVTLNAAWASASKTFKKRGNRVYFNINGYTVSYIAKNSYNIATIGDPIKPKTPFVFPGITTDANYVPTGTVAVRANVTDGAITVVPNTSTGGYWFLHGWYDVQV